jgi:soluble lytic murein transglycosylase-like protein
VSKKRILIPLATILVALLAIAGVALASSQPKPKIGLADAKPVRSRVLQRPAIGLHQAIDVQVKRIRAERRARARRERAQEAAQYASLPGGVSLSTLDAIAACESGGDPTAVSSDGTYRGKYQFDYGTWASVGGSGDPAAASESEQDYRAALLYAQSGSSPWPICG